VGLCGARGEEGGACVAAGAPDQAQSLRHSLLGSRAAYTAEIRAYVTDWRDHLAQVRQPVAIWQGSEDDWTPPAMADALAAALPQRPEVTMLQGLSHFSTLRAYLEGAAHQ
jgi:pimeloyl-ACP methyl ester carboxylesterase